MGHEQVSWPHRLRGDRRRGDSGKDGIPKLVWLKKNEPDVYSRMKCFLDVNGYLKFAVPAQCLSTGAMPPALAWTSKRRPG